MSNKNVDLTRLPPTLRHKHEFAYEYPRNSQSVCGCMHVHAVLPCFSYAIHATAARRNALWLHRQVA